MSRLSRHRGCLLRFLNNRSCLTDVDHAPTPEICNIILAYAKKSDLILPALLLTILHDQIVKNNVAVQALYFAAGIELLNILLSVIEDHSTFVQKYSLSVYTKTINFLLLCFHKSISQNMARICKSTKSNIPDTGRTFVNILSLCNDKVSYKHLLHRPEFEYTDRKPKSDILRWYIKDNEEMKQKFREIKQLDQTSLTTYIKNTTGIVCELAFCIGWFIGQGNKKKVKNIKKIAADFAMIYKIYRDFLNIEKDIMEHDGKTINYVVNYGLQHSYETYLHHKQKFISGVMLMNIYTNTTKEILNTIDQQIDSIIDQTSPDIRSFCSSA